MTYELAIAVSYAYALVALQDSRLAGKAKFNHDCATSCIHTTKDLLAQYSNMTRWS